MKLHTEASDVEIASERFQCSQGLADIIASLSDFDNEQIGRMVREGFDAALAHEREQRRDVENINTFFGLKRRERDTMEAIHGCADAEMDTDGQ